MAGALFIPGIMIGFAIAAPVGPVGVLCAQRTLSEGRMAGLVSGLGAAVADSIFGLVAAFGISVIAEFIMDHQTWVRGLGGAFLIGLGLKILIVGPATQGPNVSRYLDGHLGAFASSFLLTITNPITIMSFAGIFAAVGVLQRVVTAIDAWILVAGVFTGSCLWWLIIALGVSFFRGLISHRGMRWISRVSAGIVLAFGGLALASVIIGEDLLSFH